MALDSSIIVTTVGSSSSNSYVSVEELATYRDRTRLTADGFDGASPDDKIRSLLISAQRLKRENWMGSKASAGQALSWPRLGVVRLDGDSGEDFYGGYGGPFDVYSSTEIPQEIKDAQCELALAYLDGFDDGEEDQIDSFSADGVSVKFRQGKPAGGLPAVVSQLLSGLMRGARLVRA